MRVFVRLNWYSPERYRFELNDLLNFIECMCIEMSHMKHTCPNPHSGEKLYSQPREGAIIDVISKNGMWVTAMEYDTMKKFDEEAVELNARQLSPDLIEKYEGYRAGQKYGI